jgi:hypothetical protein
MDPMSEVEIDQVVAVFQRFATKQEVRLRRGADARVEMHAQLRAGADMSGSERFQWLNYQAKETIGFVAGVAKQYNDTHPDRVSVDDMIDVLARAIMLLQAAKAR